MTFTRSYAGFLMLACLLTGCATLDSAPKKSTPTGLISTPVSYYSTAKAKYLGTKYKENLDRLVEQIVRNPKTAPLQFANNISSVGGIGFFTHSAAKRADERFLEVVLATPETFETKGGYSEKVQRLFSQYGFDLLGILNSDNEMYQDRELSGYGLNLAWRSIVSEPAGSRVVLARAIIYLPKEKVRSYLRNNLKQDDLLADAVIFGEEEDAPLALVSFKPQEIHPDFRPAIREDNLVAAEESKPSQAISASAPLKQANEENLQIAKAAVPDHRQSRPSTNESTAREGDIENTLPTVQPEQYAGTSLSSPDSSQTAKPLSPGVIEQTKSLAGSSDDLNGQSNGNSRLTAAESKTPTAIVKPESAAEKESNSTAPESLAVSKPAREPTNKLTQKSRFENSEQPAVESSDEARTSESENQAAKPVSSAPIVQSKPPTVVPPPEQKTENTVIAKLPTASPIATSNQGSVTKKLAEELPASNKSDTIRKTPAPIATIETRGSQKNPTALPEAAVNQKTSSGLEGNIAPGENGKFQIGKKGSEPESIDRAFAPASVSGEEKKKTPVPAAKASDVHAGGLKDSKAPGARSGSPQTIQEKSAGEQIVQFNKTTEQTAGTKATVQSSTKVLQEARVNQFSASAAAASTNVEKVQEPGSAEKMTPANKLANQPTSVPSTPTVQTTEQYQHPELKSSAATPTANAGRPHEQSAPEQVALLKKPAEPILEQKPVTRPAAKVLEGYIIQIAFNDKEKAQHWAEAMERRGYAVSVTEAGAQGALRVRLGNFAVRDEAERQLRTFKQDGMNGIIINLPQGFRPQARSSVP